MKTLRHLTLSGVTLTALGILVLAGCQSGDTARSTRSYATETIDSGQAGEPMKQAPPMRQRDSAQPNSASPKSSPPKAAPPNAAPPKAAPPKAAPPRSALKSSPATAAPKTAKGDGGKSAALKTWSGRQIKVALKTDGLPEDGMWKCDPEFVDINKDGNLDLAALPRKGGGPLVWFGNGDGSWSPASEGLATGMLSCGGGIAVIDLNLDGHLDLAVADHCQGVFTYLGDGQGNWTMLTREMHPVGRIPSNYSLPSDFVGAEDIDAGDVNGDGFPDLVVMSTYKGGVNVYLGDGTGGEWRRHSPGIDIADGGNRLLLADMNNDGHLDIVAAHCAGLRVWLGGGDGEWSALTEGMPTPYFGCLFRSVAVGDVNKDGRLDIALANHVDGPDIYIQKSNGLFEQQPNAFPDLMGGTKGIALGDVNGDGNLDIVCSGRYYDKPGVMFGVYVLYGNGKGKWYFDKGTGLPMRGLKALWGVNVGDVNGDGTLDIIAATGGVVSTSTDKNDMKKIIPQQLPIWLTRVSD